MTLTYSTSYEATPWATSLDKNQRTVFIPELLENYTEQSIFYRMVDYQVDMGAMRTGEVVFTQRLKGPPNIATLDERALWLPQLYTDSQQLKIRCARYGDKIQIHKYDDRITYWRENGNEGLRSIMRGDLAPHMTQSLDRLARNAFLSATFRVFAGGASGFSNLASDDTFDVGMIRGVKLRSAYSVSAVNNPLFCITSPSAVYTVRDSDSGEWTTRNQYANPSILVNGEIGEYEDCRFVTSPLMTLWNCGTISYQTTIDASIAVGDGAPDPDVDKVDDVWEVGQVGATHGITVADTSSCAVGQRVTLHVERNASADATHVLNGVKWNSSYNLERRIVAIPNSTTLQFDEPITTDWFQTNLGAGVYGYVTYARPIHAGLFILGPRSVVCGVIQPPMTYTPAPIDDTESIWRFSWDAYLKYQPFFTNRFMVYFFAGPVDENGTVVNI
jgi:hypothetical protein